MSLERSVEGVLDRLNASQVSELAAAADGRDRPGSKFRAVTVGASPGTHSRVAALAAAWEADQSITGSGIALALRVGLQARELQEDRRARPVWTGPSAPGTQRLTSGELHQLIADARERILLVSYAAHTLPGVAADLEDRVEAGCDVDVVFETKEDSGGKYDSSAGKPFAAVSGIRRWRWPAERRPNGGLLHAKVLVVDGKRALVGSANLTSRALTANLEAGVLIRDPALAREFERHVQHLMASGLLVRA